MMIGTLVTENENQSYFQVVYSIPWGSVVGSMRLALAGVWPVFGRRWPVCDRRMASVGQILKKSRESIPRKRSKIDIPLYYAY